VSSSDPSTIHLTGKKLGLMLACAPTSAKFHHGVLLAEEALKQGLRVYLYCIDDAVAGAADERIRRLVEAGAHLFACAYGAQQRDLPRDDAVTWSGLSTLSDIIAGTDRFLCFN
jgi:sulfur relay (sulfurtransferase) complex TusBCD TusD component (DsrE family)